MCVYATVCSIDSCLISIELVINVGVLIDPHTGLTIYNTILYIGNLIDKNKYLMAGDSMSSLHCFSNDVR